MSKFQPPVDAFLGRLRAELRSRRAITDSKNQDLARALGVSASTVSGWFTGSGKPPRIHRLYQLAKEMDADLGVLIQRAEEKAHHG